MKHLATPIVTAVAASTLSFSALSAEIKKRYLNDWRWYGTSTSRFA